MSEHAMNAPGMRERGANRRATDHQATDHQAANRPLIGVPSWMSDHVDGLRFRGLVTAVTLLEAIVRAGGEPVVLYPLAASTPEERLALVDGLLIPGGPDVDPVHYGQEPHPETFPGVEARQDDADMALIRAAFDAEVPTLAICRGAQLVNVALGGTLVQHLDQADAHVGARHKVTIESDSLLARVVGTQALDVSSYHHQAIDTLGAGLTVTAYAPDGVIEALELAGKAALAVQWHPEDDASTADRHQALFDWLVESARQ